jgi:hypothetical protein
MAEAALVIDTPLVNFFKEEERGSLELCLREFGYRVSLEMCLADLLR